MYRHIALSHIITGVIVVAFAIAAGIILFASTSDTLSAGMGGLLLIVAGVIGFSLIHSGLTHRRRPTQKSAMEIAANSSVLLWIILQSVLADSSISGLLGPAHQLLPLGVAYFVYRWQLRPAALRGFQQTAQT